MKKIMKVTLMYLLFVELVGLQAFALTIASPKDGDVVYAGSALTVTVRPDAGENWENVAFGYYPMSYNILTGTYTYTFTVPASFQGIFDRIIVIGVDKSGNEIELKRNIFVKLPPNVVLERIVAGSKVVSGSTLVLLRKMQEGSSTTDIENYETAELSVRGQYSDNVNRDLTSAASGTTYTSSNEKIVTVSPEGKVTAQGLGTANITVRNGKYSATVKVVVKSYKK